MGRVNECEHIRACRMAYEGEGCEPMCDLRLPCNLYEQKVDRDALLALADEIDDPLRQAVWNQTPGVRREHIMNRYADRIRKALGVGK